jgi:hypothetical protein
VVEFREAFAQLIAGNPGRPRTAAGAMHGRKSIRLNGSKVRQLKGFAGNACEERA